jgi:hypothetical protein
MIRKCFQVFLTESQCEVLKEVARASGETSDEYLQGCVLSMLQSDIELYYGTSKAIVEELNGKLHIKEITKQ